MIRGRSDNAALGAIEQCIIRGKNRTMQLGTPGRIGVIKPLGFAKISFWIELNKAENEQTEPGEMPSRSKHRHRPAGTPRPRRPRTTRSPPARAAAGAPAADTCRSTAARRGAGRAPRSRARPQGGTRRACSTPPRTPPSPRRSRWRRPRGAPPGTRRARAGLLPLLPAASSRHPSSYAPPPPAWSPCRCPWLLAFLPLPCALLRFRCGRFA